MNQRRMRPKDRHVVGSALRAARIERQMRQKDLARLAAVGVGHLCRVEADDDYCGEMLIARFARILDCDPNKFTAPGEHPNVDTWRQRKQRRAAA